MSTRTITVGMSGSIDIDLPARPSATPTYVVFDSSSAAVEASQNATLDAVNTTLSAGASAGASSVSVASASGIVTGRRYWIGGAEETGGEQVTVKSISGTTITLARTLYRAQASGAAFASALVTCDVASIASPGRFYRLRISYAVSSVDQPPIDVPFDVVRYFPYSGLTLDALSDLDPVVRKRFPAGTWYPTLRARSWQMLLDHLAAKLDPGAVVGTIDLTTAHGYLVRALLLETAGDEYAREYDLMWRRYLTERDAALSRIPIDTNQNGTVSKSEAYFKSVRIFRG